MSPSAPIALADDDATAALGARLADALVPGDLVALRGDLGAGKTALARAIVRRLAGERDLEVPSPTFSLVQPYTTRDGRPVLHADLYRLASEAEADELGLFDRSDGIVLVEWAERAPGLLEAASVTVELAMGPGGVGRTCLVSFADGRTLPA